MSDPKPDSSPLPHSFSYSDDEVREAIQKAQDAWIAQCELWGADPAALVHCDTPMQAHRVASVGPVTAPQG